MDIWRFFPQGIKKVRLLNLYAKSERISQKYNIVFKYLDAFFFYGFTWKHNWNNHVSIRIFSINTYSNFIMILRSYFLWLEYSLSSLINVFLLLMRYCSDLAQYFWETHFEIPVKNIHTVTAGKLTCTAAGYWYIMGPED